MRRSHLIAAVLLTSACCLVFYSGFLLYRWIDGPQLDPPPELFLGIADDGRSIHTLYTKSGLGDFVPNISSGHLIVTEANLASGSMERRAHIVIDREEAFYLGPLRPIPSDGPVELLFFQVNGARMAVAWVDPETAPDTIRVTLRRSVEGIEDSEGQRVTYARTNHNVAHLFLTSTSGWYELDQVRVSTADSNGYFLVQDLSPPYPLEQEFAQHSIVWP